MLSALVTPALAASVVCATATACASDKCGPNPIRASHSGQNIDLGSCNGGDFGTPVSGHPDQLANLQLSPIAIRVGERLEFKYRLHDTALPHGAAISDSGVARLDAAPSTGSTIAVVVGVAPGTTTLTIDPTLFCGDAVDRCVIAVVKVTG